MTEFGGAAEGFVEQQAEGQRVRRWKRAEQVAVGVEVARKVIAVEVARGN